jgi:hypothetical protein
MATEIEQAEQWFKENLPETVRDGTYYGISINNIPSVVNVTNGKITILGYNGKCPICQGQLHLDGDHLECTNKDYRCLRVDFENRWDEYDKHPGNTNKLVRDLVKLNLIKA